MIVRPFGLILNGRLERGLEIHLAGGEIVEIRPQSGLPEPMIVSAAFVNAHSHLEYRGLQGMTIPAEGYWSWLREITLLKGSQLPDEIERDCHLAARENRETGVAYLGEHSDRPYAGSALVAHRLGGRIHQEVITIREHADPGPKLAEVMARRDVNRASGFCPVELSPHALFTVDAETLTMLGAQPEPISIHLAEHASEREFYLHRTGPIADFYAQQGFPAALPVGSPVQVAAQLGLLRSGTQVVHACAVDDQDLRLLRESGASVAHCPRSNRALGCPIAPIRRMLAEGIPVGLGLDSAASSGPIDMFAEMRAALQVSEQRGEPLSGEDVWRMVTDGGARSLALEGYGIHPGSRTPLIALDLADVETEEELIQRATPAKVRWIG